ncbi:MAG TPA: hypothetical protein VF715_09145 [Thermoleophilaceae bacterium]
MPRIVLTAVVVLMSLSLGVADAAARQVPKHFTGVVYDREIHTAPQSLQREQWATMAASGVESARVLFMWEAAQRRKQDPISFAYSDVLVEEAARHGIDLLPIVMYAPAWARLANHPASAPRDNGDYTRYLRALVRRYGPSGSFWRTHPDVPRRPVRAWQIWNEPHLEWQFHPAAGWAERYGALLRASHRAVKSVDPGARIVLGGIVNDAWRTIEKLYRRGHIHGAFDVAALHAYAGDPDDFVEVLRRFRAALDASGGRKRPIYITEAGASASAGVLDAPDQSYFQVTHEEMRRLVPAAFKRLARVAAANRLERVYWYTWASGYASDMTIFGFAGLNAYARGGEVYGLPGLDGYRKMARELQGCTKDTRARCVR